MNDTSPTAPGDGEIHSVYLWLVKPDVGAENLLMIHVMDPDAGPIYRPVMALDRDTAVSPTTVDTVKQAAEALGVRCVLRQYDIVDIRDLPDLAPRPGADPTILAEVTP